MKTAPCPFAASGAWRNGMLKKLLGRAAAGLLAGTLLLSAMPAACAIEQEALSQPVEIPYADRFDGRTLAEIMADFMAENGVGEDNFALSYYNTVTGERYDFNENCMMVAASTFKLPLNMYYYDLQRAGSLTGETQITENCDLDECHYQTIVWSNNEIAHGMLYRIGNFTQYKNAMLTVFGMENEQIDPKYYMDNYYSTRMMMSALEKLYENAEDYEEMIGYMKQANPQNGYFRRDVTECEVAHKYGSFEGAENDVGIIYAEQPFLLAVYTLFAGPSGGEVLCGDAARLLKDYTDYRTACEQEAERQAAEQAAREEAERKEAEEKAAQEEAERKAAEEKAAQEEAERVAAEEAARQEALLAAAQQTTLAEKEQETDGTAVVWTDYLWVAAVAAGIVLAAFLILRSATRKVGKYEARMKKKYGRFTDAHDKTSHRK